MKCTSRVNNLKRVCVVLLLSTSTSGAYYSWPSLSFPLQENRYEMYVKLLKDGVKELLTAKENDAALKKSQSSPHLNQESQPAAAKIKRNTSERKDYRPETPKVT